ncbi:E3 ubiquitin-protein ligase arih1 [Orchesella cincta]|uniref:RBR-type E3 ubiquitin transferase n=1 Tax=Orchesella cincta TaxID=48709 RepID=A0A1D2ML82_ORCCI|nr:E3 ubiquitin-protein ligase arih1 [Orchesella cincta]
MAGKREASSKSLGADEVIKKAKMESSNNREWNMDSSEELYFSDDEDEDGGSASENCDFPSSGSSEVDDSDVRPDIQILTVAELEKQMKNVVLQIQQKLCVSPSDALLLLNHFGWDTQKLLEMYYEEKRDEYFKKHGLPWNSEEVEDGSGDAKPRAVVRKGQEIECRICFLSFKIDESFEHPRCGHCFCSDCSYQYINTRISENGLQSSIQCPESKCNVLLKEDYIKNVMKADLEAVKRYDRLLINDYVTRNRHLEFCPGERCDAIWKLEADGVPWNFKEVGCNCKETFCFSCNKTWHFPLSCKLHQLWMKRLSDESENSSWIVANTKPCPKCTSSIQKNGGCNHMTCRKCHHQFCWLCLTAWNDHRDFYNCSRQPDAATNEAQAAARNHLQRFMFANERFLGHGHSYTLEKDLLKDSLFRMDQIRTVCKMEQLNDAAFYVDAIKALLICRKLLQYSFAFVFYLKREGEPQVEIFETNMINLHEAVEELSQHLDNERLAKDLGDKKEQVLNLTNFCKQRRKVLIDHVNEGYADANWRWVFRQDLAPGVTI